MTDASLLLGMRALTLPLLALMFFLFQAPDVALSQIVVNAVALPMMVSLALVKIRRNAETRRLAEQRRKQREGR